MDNEIRIIDSKTGRKIYSIAYSVNKLKWSGDGKKLFASNKAGLTIFHANNGSLIGKITDGTIRAWYPDKNLIVIPYKNNITLINATDGKAVQTFSVKIDDNFTKYYIYDPTWSPDGKKIAYIIGKEGDYRLQVLNCSSGKTIGTSQISSYRYYYWHFQWSPNSKNIAAEVFDFGKELIWFDISNISDSRWLNYKSYDFNGTPTSGYRPYMSWSPDGRYLAVNLNRADFGINCKIIDTKSFSIVSSIREIEHSPSDIAWSLDDKKIVVCCGKELKIIDVETLETWEVKTGKLNTNTSLNIILSVDWSSDGRRIAYSVGKNVGVIDVTDGNLSVVFHHPEWVVDAIWSPDGTKIATISQGRIYIWDLESKNIITTLKWKNLSYGSPFNSIAFSPDGTKFASGLENSSIKIWNTHTWEVVRVLSLKNFPWESYGDIYAVAWSPDGNKIAGSFEYDFLVWDANSGEKLRFYSTNNLHLDGQSTIKKIEWSPDGKKIATLEESSLWVAIWDYHTDCVKILSVLYPSYISTFSWSHNGNNIVTAHDDGKIRIWSSPADLKIKEVNVIPSDNEIIIGKNLTICTSIVNEGKKNATSFWVDLYVDDVKIDERKIDFIRKEGGMITIQTNFTPYKYNHKIDVIVDSDGFVPESNKENNYESKIININKEKSFEYSIIVISLISVFLFIFLFYRRKRWP